jgi:hypothetical protein
MRLTHLRNHVIPVTPAPIRRGRVFCRRVGGVRDWPHVARKQRGDTSSVYGAREGTAKFDCGTF